MFVVACAGGLGYVRLGPRETHAIVGKLEEHASKVSTIHFRARAELYFKGKARKGYLEVFATARELRAEVWSPTDNLLDYLVLCKDKGAAIEVVPPRRRCYWVKKSLFGMPLVGDYARFFAGAGVKLESVTGEQGEGGDVVRLEGMHQGHRCREVIEGGKVTEIVCALKDGPVRVKYSRFLTKAGLLIPGYTRIDFPGGTAILRYRSVELGKPMEPGTFDCQCPGGFVWGNP